MQKSEMRVRFPNLSEEEPTERSCQLWWGEERKNKNKKTEKGREEEEDKEKKEMKEEVEREGEKQEEENVERKCTMCIVICYWEQRMTINWVFPLGKVEKEEIDSW